MRFHNSENYISVLLPGGVSIIKKSNSPQHTSVTNCFTIAVFLGPLQTTEAFRLFNKNPIDITDKFFSSSVKTGTHLNEEHK